MYIIVYMLDMIIEYFKNRIVLSGFEQIMFGFEKF
jgi:hypothetical protein